MAEKDLRKNIDEIARELEEIKAELSIRLGGLKKKIMPFVYIGLGLIGLKIALKIMGLVFALIWKLKSLIFVGLLLVLLKLYLSQSGKQCSA